MNMMIWSLIAIILYYYFYIEKHKQLNRFLIIHSLLNVIFLLMIFFKYNQYSETYLNWYSFGIVFTTILNKDFVKDNKISKFIQNIMISQLFIFLICLIIKLIWR